MPETDAPSGSPALEDGHHLARGAAANVLVLLAANFRGVFTFLIARILGQTALGQRPSMDVFGTDYDTPDGTCLRDYIHVSDLIAAHMDALSHLRRGGESGVFNCGYGTGYSVLEVISAVEKAHGGPIKANRVARRAGDPAAIIAGADRVKAILGWKPKYNDLDAIVASALAWENHLLRRNAA